MDQTVSALIFFGLLIYLVVKHLYDNSASQKWKRYEENKKKYPDDPFKWYEK